MNPVTNILPLLLSLTLHAQTPVEPEARVPVLDDARHTLVSFGLVAHGYAASRWIGMDRTDARIVAIGATAVIGIAKEVWDLSRGGRFDVGDLAFDAVGVALGALLAGATR